MLIIKITLKSEMFNVLVEKNDICFELVCLTFQPMQWWKTHLSCLPNKLTTTSQVYQPCQVWDNPTTNDRGTTLATLNNKHYTHWICLPWIVIISYEMWLPQCHYTYLYKCE